MIVQCHWFLVRPTPHLSCTVSNHKNGKNRKTPRLKPSLTQRQKANTFLKQISQNVELLLYKKKFVISEDAQSHLFIHPWRCSRIMLNTMCSVFWAFVEVNCLFIGLHLSSITAFESRKKISFRQVNKSVQSGWFMENAGSSNSHQNHITSLVILTSQP